MTFLLSIIAFVVILSALILIHEFGHFYVARKAGIKVEEFALGFGPKIFSFRPEGSETLYLLKLIPVGGYVRVYGEDTTDKKALESDRSYASKSPRVKLAVAAAGVIMNFLLALVLLTIGFIVGMQPLLVTPQDVFQSIDKGLVTIEEGMVIKSAREVGGFMPQSGDKILSVNGKPILTGQELAQLQNGQKVALQILHGNQEPKEWQIEWNKSDAPVKTFDIIPLSRIVLEELPAHSSLAQFGLRDGDILLSVNNKNIYSLEDLRNALAAVGGSDNVAFRILRDGRQEMINGEIWSGSQVAISEVYPDTPAEKAGLLKNDLVIAINDYPLSSISDVQVAMGKGKDNQVKYTVLRMGNSLDILMQPDQKGLVGVALSPLFYERLGEFTYYLKPVLTSLIKIENVRYPFWQAPLKALEESYRLSALTIQSFANVIGTLVTRFSVPQGVSGPVGIAQMTYTFVQEGFISLLRFAALLSLSLAMINIFPLPALDGSRFFIILFSVIIGKNLDARIETWIHIIGFIILMLLIALITYNDIVRLLFSS